VPFCAILALTALKEIVEDLKRHKADRKVNHSEVDVLSAEGHAVKKKWRDVCVGDIIRVVNEKYFPADLILLSSSEPAGKLLMGVNIVEL
jgi:phospholipid-transporting ATPase